MGEIENTNNLTLAQLIEIWEICNSPMNCQKCPLNDKSCAKILHTATLEALKNLVKLVDLQKEENERLSEENKKIKCYIGNGWGYVSFLEFIKSQKAEAVRGFAKLLIDESTDGVISIEDLPEYVLKTEGDTE